MIITKCAILSAVIITSVGAFSENSVYRKSPPNLSNELVTSSTLRWISSEKGSHPETAVVGTVEIVKNEESALTNPSKRTNDENSESDGIFQRNVYICRAKHVGYGIWVPGQLKTGSEGCIISQHDKVETYEKYEVLENVEGGARLSWVQWTKFSDVPVGAISAGEQFVARRKVEKDKQDIDNLGAQHLIGKLKDSRGFAKLIAVNEEGKEQEFTDGEVLIETEPIRYELTNIRFITNNNNNKKSVKKQLLELGIKTLENIQNVSGKVDSVIEYEANSSVYWGQGKAMLKGLPTVIRSSNSNVLEEIKWGISEDENRQNLYKVEMYLYPGTAVNITLKGNNTETETPYTAKLIAIYQDGAHRARTIQGIHQEIQMIDITPEFSDVFFTANFSLVPTTTTTTTTTTTLAPTTQKITTEINSISTNEITKTNEERKREKTMMNDEGSKVNSTTKSTTTNQGSSIASINFGQGITITSLLVLLWRKQI